MGVVSKLNPRFKPSFKNDAAWPLCTHFIPFLTKIFVWKPLHDAVNLKMHWHTRVNMHTSQQEPTFHISSPLLSLVQQRA